MAECSKEETTFLKQHQSYDQACHAVNLLHCIITSLFGKEHWEMRLREYLAGELGNMPPVIAAIIKQYAPIAQVAETYRLSNLKPVNNLNYNYVLPGFQGSQPIILKLGLDIDGFKREAAALMAFSGFGVVHVLIENNGLLLLECAVPGISLKPHFPENDDEAIHITANVIRRLHNALIPHAHLFPHVKGHFFENLQDKNVNI